MKATRPSTVLATFLFIRSYPSQIVINQQCNEQRNEIEDGVAESLHGRLWPFGEHQVNRSVHESTAQQESSCQVDDSTHACQVRQDADQHHDDGVEQGMQFGEFITMGNGQHRNISLGVVFLAMNSEWPEMR